MYVNWAFSQFRQCLSRFLAFLWVHFSSLFYLIELALAPFPAALTLTAVWKWHLMTSTSKPPEGLQSTLRKLLTTHNISYSNYSVTTPHSILHCIRLGLWRKSEQWACQSTNDAKKWCTVSDCLTISWAALGSLKNAALNAGDARKWPRAYIITKKYLRQKHEAKISKAPQRIRFKSVICQKDSAQLPENCFAANQQDNQTMYIREILYLQIIREQHHKNHEEHGWAWLRAHCPCHFTTQHHLRRRKTNLGESDAEVRQAHHQPESNSKMQSKGSKYQDERNSNAIRCH
jgi:hypothetical protein